MEQPDPEYIPFSDYVRDPSQYDEITRRHWEKHRVWIEEEMQRLGFAWVVVCGEEIVAGSPDIFDFPNEEELREYGERYQRIPFAYTVFRN